MSAKTEAIRKAIETGDQISPIPDADWISLGCVPLDLAISGRRGRGAAKGFYVYYVGDSSTGKTYFVMSACAEANKNPAFDKHLFIYDAPEFGNMFSIAKFFGKGVADRLEPAAGTWKKPKPSRTVQELYYNLDALNDKGKPYVYVVDSMDSLLDESDEEKFADERDAWEKGKEVKGSFGMGKAKTNSKNICRVVADLQDTGSMLFLVSQTRDKVGGYGGRTRAGGRALRFYAHVELWTADRGDLKKTVNKRERVYGKNVEIDVQKNRVNGWEGKVNVPFLWQHGIDDTGACINYLTDEKEWPRDSKSGIIDAKDFGVTGRLDEVAVKIENTRGGREKLGALVERVWTEIAEATKAERKPRYT